MAQLMTTFGSRADILGNMADAAQPADASSNLAELNRRLPSAEALAAEFGLQGVDQAVAIGAYPEQHQAFASIVAKPSGLVLLTGGPGSGKVSMIHWLWSASLDLN